MLPVLPIEDDRFLVPRFNALDDLQEMMIGIARAMA